jgi:hypothetical protein
MRLFAIAALTVATFVTTMLVGYTQASAVVCARGVYRAGCVGPHGAVVVHRHPYHRYRY